MAEQSAEREIHFDSKFRSMSSSRCLNLLRFRKSDLLKMVRIFGWPEFQTSTRRNGYSAAFLLVSCTVLWRFHTTSTWDKSTAIFGKQTLYFQKFFGKV